MKPQANSAGVSQREKVPLGQVSLWQASPAGRGERWAHQRSGCRRCRSRTEWACDEPGGSSWCHAKLSAERSRGVRLSLVGKGKHQQGREEPSLNDHLFFLLTVSFLLLPPTSPSSVPCKTLFTLFFFEYFFLFLCLGKSCSSRGRR